MEALDMALKVQRVPRAELRCTCMVPDRLSLRQMEQIWSVVPTTGWCATGMRCHLTRLSVRRVACAEARRRETRYLICYNETPKQHSASAIVYYTILRYTNYSGPRVSGGFAQARPRRAVGAVPQSRYAKDSARRAREPKHQYK